MGRSGVFGCITNLTTTIDKLYAYIIIDKVEIATCGFMRLQLDFWNNSFPDALVFESFFTGTLPLGCSA